MKRINKIALTTALFSAGLSDAEASTDTRYGRYHSLNRASLEFGVHQVRPDGKIERIHSCKKLQVDKSITSETALLDMLTTLENDVGSASVKQLDDGSSIIEGRQWRAFLNPSGTKGRILRVKDSEEWLLHIEPPSDKKLESRARAFLSNYGAHVVPLGEGESMPVWRTGYALDEHEDEDGNVITDTVSESYIVFSRTKLGIDVVGPGSKIAVAFDQKNQVREMTFDWPALRTSEQGSLRPIHDLVRKSEVSMLEKGYPSNREQTYVHCGYFDPGEESREQGQSIEASCLFGFMGSTELETSKDSAEALVSKFGFDVLVSAEK